MANTRKRTKRKKVNRRVVRHTPEPLSKLEVFYIAKHEMPDWIVGDKGIIPSIPTPDEDDD